MLWCVSNSCERCRKRLAEKTSNNAMEATAAAAAGTAVTSLTGQCMCARCVLDGYVQSLSSVVHSSVSLLSSTSSYFIYSAVKQPTTKQKHSETDSKRPPGPLTTSKHCCHYSWSWTQNSHNFLNHSGKNSLLEIFHLRHIRITTQI